MESQFRVGSHCSWIHCDNADMSLTPLAWPTMFPKDLFFVPGMPRHHCGLKARLIMLAIVDGEFEGEEQRVILDIGTGLGLSERRVNSLYNECVLNPDQVDCVPAKDPKERLQHLVNLCRVMLADGKIVDWESVLIFPLAIKLGFDSEDVASILEELEDQQVN